MAVREDHRPVPEDTDHSAAEHDRNPAAPEQTADDLAHRQTEFGKAIISVENLLHDSWVHKYAYKTAPRAPTDQGKKAVLKFQVLTSTYPKSYQSYIKSEIDYFHDQIPHSD